MDFARADLEVQPAKNLAMVALGRPYMEVLDSEKRFAHSFDPTAPPELSLSP